MGASRIRSDISQMLCGYQYERKEEDSEIGWHRVGDIR